MIDRIAKLIALAEAAGTVEEAEAAFAKAQELATRHQIDLELARLQAAPKARQTPVQRVITIGVRGKRSNASLVELFDTIGRANDVKCLIAHDSTRVYAHGFPSDLDTTEALWSSLAATMTRFADAHVRDKNAPWRSETVEVYDPYAWTYITKPISGQAARRSFNDGFRWRIAERLQKARQESIKVAEHFHQEQQATGEISGSTLPSSMALVLKEKATEVEEFMWAEDKRKYGKDRRNRIGSWKGGRSSTAHSSSAASAGRSAANSAALSGRKAVGA